MYSETGGIMLSKACQNFGAQKHKIRQPAFPYFCNYMLFNKTGTVAAAVPVTTHC
jgi:hypothetical protein